MKSEDLKAVFAKSKKSPHQYCLENELSYVNFMTKVKRESLKDEDLKKIAAALNCKYYCYFEMKDGTKIGMF